MSLEKELESIFLQIAGYFFSVERCCTCIYVQQKEAHFSPSFEHKSKLEIDKLCM